MIIVSGRNVLRGSRRMILVAMTVFIDHVERSGHGIFDVLRSFRRTNAIAKFARPANNTFKGCRTRG